jgi:hypothetical protein
MSYPPQEGYPPAPAPPTAAQPTVGIPGYPPPALTAPAPSPGASGLAAPSYGPALAQISGTPYPAPPGRRPTVLVLSIAAALLLVFGGLMLGLYVNERGNLHDTQAALTDTRAQVEQQKTLVTQQTAKTTAAEKNAADLTAQLDKKNTDLNDMKGQRDVLIPCMRRIQDAFDAAANGDSGGISNALRQARTLCDKAEIKVDS